MTELNSTAKRFRSTKVMSLKTLLCRSGIGHIMACRIAFFCAILLLILSSCKDECEYGTEWCEGNIKKTCRWTPEGCLGSSCVAKEQSNDCEKQEHGLSGICVELYDGGDEYSGYQAFCTVSNKRCSGAEGDFYCMGDLMIFCDPITRYYYFYQDCSTYTSGSTCKVVGNQIDCR